MEIYLDNSSTTKVRKEVLNEIIDINENYYGNPSSIHRKGLEIEKKITQARKSVAKILNAKQEEIYFTAGGTESNNIAIYGLLGNLNDNNNIITTKIEHPSVYNIFKYFEKKVNVKYLNTDEQGKINLDELLSFVDENTSLVSIMLVNNEIGTIQDINKVVELVKSKNKKTKIHVDAIQAYGKIKIDVNKTMVDTISFSSHKIHGPKGVGGLYIRHNTKLTPSIFGGNQEKGVRPGTENTPNIVGFGKACELVYENFEEEQKKLYDLKQEYAKRLIDEIENIKINSCLNEIDGAPHILNVSFKNIRGEVLVHYLENLGIYVSTGSACSSKAKTDNRILSAINLNPDYLDGTIRISLGYFNSFDEIEYVVKSIKKSVEEIRNIMKM
ncbi:MAG: iscS1 [Bacillota bacterium]|jgi:cysteine desulfurase|nr:iscS1 [Bacillota bacterium]